MLHCCLHRPSSLQPFIKGVACVRMLYQMQSSLVCGTTYKLCTGFREALTATAEDLLSMNVIPVFNENDAILSAMPLLVHSLIDPHPNVLPQCLGCTSLTHPVYTPNTCFQCIHSAACMHVSQLSMLMSLSEIQVTAWPPLHPAEGGGQQRGQARALP